ncbi:putative inactive cadmium/zinc-transporting ATPase HMA3 [Tasmannia lanceolata]|uniref:putative inactive cadmium/zinc-transporting ATPase HMA3 n=1 Tax=Tasmannia lanceolata TaxID=3420 RepID=UPI004062BC9F
MGSVKTNVIRFQKSYFDVLGLCCSSEVPLIEKILKPLEGIEKVSVIVPSRTVIVVHDNLLISQLQIVKLLNQARLEANVRVYGEEKNGKRWPSPYTLASGCLLVLSFFKYLFHPLHWLALGAAAVGLPPIMLRSIASIRSLSLDINILMLIAVGGTIAMRDYTEAGSIVFLFTIAEWLESRASHKATAVMSSLMRMAPQKATLAENGLIVDVEDVKVSTILAVKAGEVIPIDGIVVEGKSEVDERSLTGESVPVAKQIQSQVWAGTINLNGYMSVETTSLAEDSAVARMTKLVEEAQHNKSKTQRIIDKCAKFYTPAIVVISAGIALIPTALRVHDRKRWYSTALVLLVTACPCALVLSTPVATFCALTKAAASGLLVKGGDYLELLAKVKIVAFDKTGTITRGEFTVTEFRSIDPDVSSNTLLYWISSIESKASHPMAAALVDYSRLNGVEPKPENVKEFQIFPGEGIYGKIDDKDIYIGNKRLATRAGCITGPTAEGIKDGLTVGYVVLEGTLVGIFNLSDTCRTGVAQAIKELRSLGIKTAMLTGDSHAAALRVHDQLGQAIELVHSELLPEEKVRIIKELKKTGPTAMVGDGMNDGPALATADVGISMGISGSAVATETGHITLMSNDIRKVPQAIRLARRTRQKIIENIGLSIITKAATVGLAISGHPLVWVAVLSDVGTCLLVIFNSMLLLRGTKAPRSKCCESDHGSHDHKHGSHDSHGHHKKQSCGSGHGHLTHVHRRCCSRPCEDGQDGPDGAILQKGSKHVRHECSMVVMCGKAPHANCGNKLKPQENCTNHNGDSTCGKHECHKGPPPKSDHPVCCSGSGSSSPEHVISINSITEPIVHEHELGIHSSGNPDGRSEEGDKIDGGDLLITHKKHGCCKHNSCSIQASIAIEA